MLLHELPPSMLHCTGPRASYRVHRAATYRLPLPRTPHQLRTLPQPTRSPLSAAASTSTEAQIEKEKQAHPDVLRQMLNYRYEVDTPEGLLVIAALREEWLPRCADLLADAFVDTKGIPAYRRYVRKQIHTYLELHHKMPPSAVVLTAILHTTVMVSKDVDSLMLEGSLPELQPSSNGNGAHGSSNNAAAEARLKAISSESSSDSDSSSISSSPSSRLEVSASSSRPETASSSSSSASTCPINNSSSNATTSSSSSHGFRGVLGAVMQHLASGLGLQQQQQEQQQEVGVRKVQQLVGVAEVSFREFTRSSNPTLNPPKKCAYLCNMAVSADWRRRGIASHLMTAAEDLCFLADEQDVYLHLRRKDAVVAGGLYSKAGFVSFKKDWPIVFLIGLEPQVLMRKQLSTARQLVGKVLLPQQEQQLIDQQQHSAKIAAAAVAVSPAA